MSRDPGFLVGLYRGLLNQDPQRRAENADSVTDLRKSMDAAELHSIGAVLAALAVWEPGGKAREAQLHALAELHEWDSTTPDAIDLLRRIDRVTLAGSEIEYISYLLGE
jgi:hypothetical protein